MSRIESFEAGDCDEQYSQRTEQSKPGNRACDGEKRLGPQKGEESLDIRFLRCTREIDEAFGRRTGRVSNGLLGHWSLVAEISSESSAVFWNSRNNGNTVYITESG